MQEKFGLGFEIFSLEKRENSSSRNYFEERDQIIVRLDQMARNEEYLEQLKHTDWDLIVVDEAEGLSVIEYGITDNLVRLVVSG